LKGIKKSCEEMKLRRMKSICPRR